MESLSGNLNREKAKTAMHDNGLEIMNNEFSYLCNNEGILRQNVAGLTNQTLLDRVQWVFSHA